VDGRDSELCSGVVFGSVGGESCGSCNAVLIAYITPGQHAALGHLNSVSNTV